MFDDINEVKYGKGADDMSNQVYEITNIFRHTGALEADSLRIGKRIIPTGITKGFPAVLVYEENHDMAIMTSPVTHEYVFGDGSIGFITKNTTYTLRKVDA